MLCLKENWGLERKPQEAIGKPSIFVRIIIKIGKMGFDPAIFQNALR